MRETLVFSKSSEVTEHIKQHVSVLFIKQHVSALLYIVVTGSYFARDASYSNKYSALGGGGGGKKIMFVATVLVGDYIKGRSAYLRPPAREKGKGFYDSCVDSVSNPSIFVIFEKHQVYPEFIVEYS